MSRLRHPVVPMMLALSALGGGCGPRSGPADGEAKAAPQPRVVVAVIDSGINPYHAWFNASQPGLESPIYPPGAPPSSVTPEVLAEFGIGQDHVINLHRTGNPGADHAADQAQWDQLVPGEPYWFRGTNIIAVGRRADGLAATPDTGPLILPDSDADAHGVSVVAAVLAANPEAIVYFVEHNGDDTATDIASARAHELGFLHPAVDIVSTSYGRIAPEGKAFFHTFRAVVGLGKLHFASAGNVPEPAAYKAGPGPWWSVGVGGYEEGRSNGRSTTSAFFPDFSAAFALVLPSCAICQVETEDGRGTSLSVAVAAGVASRVLLEARRSLGHAGGIASGLLAEGASLTVSNWQLRRALEQAAYVPDAASYDPLTGDPRDVWGAQPIVAPAPWLQVAWGVLSPDPTKAVVAEALGFLGLGPATRVKDPGFCEFQTKNIEQRHAYWDNLAPAFDAVVPDEIAGEDLDTGGDAPAAGAGDPFIYCGSRLPPA